MSESEIQREYEKKIDELNLPSDVEIWAYDNYKKDEALKAYLNLAFREVSQPDRFKLKIEGLYEKRTKDSKAGPTPPSVSQLITIFSNYDARRNINIVFILLFF